jgi:hypothetical protein
MSRDRERVRGGSRKVRWVFRGLLAACLLVFAFDFLHEKHGYVPWERWAGFQSGFGFLAGLVVILLAHGLRRLVGRGRDYYER